MMMGGALELYPGGSGRPAAAVPDSLGEGLAGVQFNGDV